MSVPPRLSSPPSEHPEPNEELRGRVSAAFEKLATFAPELNAVSDELAKPILAINKALQTLNLGVAAWVTFEEQQHEGELLSVHSIGYAKVAGRWGIAIRYEGTDSGGEPETREWPFGDAPRSLRLKALDHLPALLDELANTAGKTAGSTAEQDRHDGTGCDDDQSNWRRSARVAGGRPSWRSLGLRWGSWR